MTTPDHTRPSNSDSDRHRNKIFKLVEIKCKSFYMFPNLWNNNGLMILSSKSDSRETWSLCTNVH